MDNLIKEYEAVRMEYSNIIVNKFRTEDYYNYVNDLFTAHSCAIEGNSFSVDDTRALREKGLSLKLQDKSMFEAFEILDHFKAYQFAINNLDKLLSEDLLKKIHFYLTEHTMEYSNGTQPSEYTTSDMAVGETLFGDHERNIANIPKLLEQTNIALENSTNHPVSISAMFHKHFIYLHPFRDGNGRMGRILSNFILAQKGHPPVIVLDKNKKDYVNALTASHKHRDMTPIVSFFFTTSIKRMKAEIEQKINLTENFFIGIKEENDVNEEKKSFGRKR